MTKWFALFLLMIGTLPCNIRVMPLEVTEVRHGLVTMQGYDSVYQIDEDEAWRVGDRATAIINSEKIVEVRFVWRR